VLAGSGRLAGDSFGKLAGSMGSGAARWPAALEASASLEVDDVISTAAAGSGGLVRPCRLRRLYLVAAISFVPGPSEASAVSCSTKNKLWTPRALNYGTDENRLFTYSE
jgi:hypothetical protein